MVATYDMDASISVWFWIFDVIVASERTLCRIFNSSLDGNVRRAIDIREGEKIDEAALKDLIRAAAALNLKGKSKAARLR